MIKILGGIIIRKFCKKKLLLKLKNVRGIWFHIVGIACLIWFAIRVLPAPHRSQYPCQQLSFSIAIGYIAFWSGLFYLLSKWIKNVKFRTSAIAPSILVIFIILFSISGFVFANNYDDKNEFSTTWNPLPNDPIGNPYGLNPGRVVWVWNPEATESDLNGYWWNKENNNQEVIEQMLSDGLKGLIGEENDYTSWDLLFKHFNDEHGYGEVGYQTGEKIAIKINLNNNWDLYGSTYKSKDNDRDASPYLVKALLRSLINTVGVAEEDITVYDASRKMGNWFYNRVYYKDYPADPLDVEFENVNFVDSTGGAEGRQKVESSSEKIYFTHESNVVRTLPTCVVDAKYIINMPILKRHPINHGVTLSGKNFFGTWIEPVMDIHEYHESSFTLNNPAPHVELFAHEHIGAKTILYIGDGTFATKIDHKTIAKFLMYPFNNDWTNSLFLSQDPVAIDSVMYDFLHAEGTDPVEGSQYYLHQSAEPPLGIYDPENDGVFVSDSLGVHEHWDTAMDIFSSDRYSGPSEEGIDYISFGEEYANPAIIITNPISKNFYIFGRKICSFPFTLLIGRVNVESQINGLFNDVDKVEFYLDGVLQHEVEEEPFIWAWQKPAFFKHEIQVKAYYNERNVLESNMSVWRFL
jgi:hypothetical protein